MKADEREHVVILGGGVGGCVAAYWLTATEELRKKYRVTLYQMGWRLGGKGASSRNPEQQWRSEEHGPHVWFGFYENAFRTMRECVEEHAALGFEIGDRTTMADLFEPSYEGVFFDKLEDGTWNPWKLELDRYPHEPGDDQPVPDIREDLWRVADHLSANLSELGIFGPGRNLVLSVMGKILGRTFPAKQPGQCKRPVNPGDPTGMASYLSKWLVDLADSEKVWYGEAVVGRGLKWFLDYLGWKIRRMSRRKNLSIEKRRELAITDLYRTCLRGALVDLLIRDVHFADLDKMEFLKWLELHGAAYTTLEESCLLRGYYDTPFAFTGGCKDKQGKEMQPNFAAGAALRGFFRIFFGYKGAYLYRMTLGMGECVFVPMYRVLEKRGVKFEFFHRVTELVPDENGNRIGRIELSRQAELADGVDRYDPLIFAPGPDGGDFWPVWPNRPKAELLKPGSLPPADDPGLESAWSRHRGTKVELYDRRRAPAEGAAFDHVVLAIPPGAHRHMAGRLIEGSTRFGRMVESSVTVRTVASQLWVSGAEDGLGWQRDGMFCEHALAGGGPSTMNIILEASPILKSEATSGVRHLIYLCGPVGDDFEEPPHDSDPGYPAAQLAKAKADTLAGLEVDGHLWPGLCKEDRKTFDARHLHHPENPDESQVRIEWQYFRMNIDPSDRYVLSTDGSAPHRLAPWDSWYNNLTFSGDWCRNAIDIGCVESAATSGMLAANRICGYPAMETIAGQEYV